MSSMFGSSESKTTVPAYIEDASKQAIGMAQNRNALGYIPKYGAEIAALTGQQMAAMNGANQMAGSLGLQTAPMNIPTATNYGGGITGYSSQGMYQKNMAELEAANPELYAAINALMGKSTAQAQNGGSLAGFGQGQNRDESRLSDHTNADDNFNNTPGTNSTFGSWGGGYTDMRDRFDGGGAGQSGTGLGSQIGGSLGGFIGGLFG